jgi:hypothetical protein
MGDVLYGNSMAKPERLRLHETHVEENKMKRIFKKNGGTDVD